jgi:hypothetical protein
LLARDCEEEENSRDEDRECVVKENGTANIEVVIALEFVLIFTSQPIRFAS